MTALAEYRIEDVPGLSGRAVRKLKEEGHHFLGDLSVVETHSLYSIIGFEQSRKVMKALLRAGGEARFSKPDWSEEDWMNFVQGRPSLSVSP